MARGSVLKRCPVCRKEGKSGWDHCSHKEAVYVVAYREGYKQKRETYPTRKQADRRLAEVNALLMAGSTVTCQKIYFKDYSEKWLDKYAKANVKLSTLRTYRNTLKIHVLPVIGHYEISRISPESIQGLIARTKEGRTPKTANNVLVLLKRMFKYAIIWGYLMRNPTDNVAKIKTAHKEMGYLTAEEVRKFLASAREPFKTLFMTAIFTGMRRGELLGLQWQDIDFDRNIICVRRALYWAYKEPGRTGEAWEFSTPKSRNAYRAIFLSPKLKEALLAHKQVAPVSLHDLVFCGDQGQPLHPDTMVHNHFLPTLTRAKVRKIRFHDLRHTFVSLLIDQGQAPLKFIQNQVGHASAQTTLDRYGHLMPIEMYADVSRRLDNILTEPPEKTTKE